VLGDKKPFKIAASESISATTNHSKKNISVIFSQIKYAPALFSISHSAKKKASAGFGANLFFS